MKIALWVAPMALANAKVPLRTEVRSVLFVCTRFDKWSPLATSAVTVDKLRMHLNAAESTELPRRISVKSESPLSFLHCAAQKRIGLHGVEMLGYDTKYVTEHK